MKCISMKITNEYTNETKKKHFFMFAYVLFSLFFNLFCVVCIHSYNFCFYYLCFVALHFIAFFALNFMSFFFINSYILWMVIWIETHQKKNANCTFVESEVRNTRERVEQVQMKTTKNYQNTQQTPQKG